MTHGTKAVAHFFAHTFSFLLGCAKLLSGFPTRRADVLAPLIHLLLLPAVLCILEFTALNIVVKTLAPKTENMTFYCHEWYR